MRALLFLLITVIAGIGLISLGIKTAHLNARFDEAAVRVQATADQMIGGNRLLSGGYSSKSHLLPHLVTYHYDAADGRHESTDSVSSQTWKILQTIHVLPVKYLQGDPSVCRIDLPDQDAGYRAEVWIDYVAGFSLLALGCIGYGRASHARNP
jgi:hypothetical protein